MVARSQHQRDEEGRGDGVRGRTLIGLSAEIVSPVIRALMMPEGLLRPALLRAVFACEKPGQRQSRAGGRLLRPLTRPAVNLDDGAM